jgi:hypothetical protein
VARSWRKSLCAGPSLSSLPLSSQEPSPKRARVDQSADATKGSASPERGDRRRDEDDEDDERSISPRRSPRRSLSPLNDARYAQLERRVRIAGACLCIESEEDLSCHVMRPLLRV